MITNEGPEKDMLRSEPHTAMLILWILQGVQTRVSGDKYF